MWRIILIIISIFFLFASLITNVDAESINASIIGEENGEYSLLIGETNLEIRLDPNENVSNLTMEYSHEIFQLEIPFQYPGFLNKSKEYDLSLDLVPLINEGTHDIAFNFTYWNESDVFCSSQYIITIRIIRPLEISQLDIPTTSHPQFGLGFHLNINCIDIEILYKSTGDIDTYPNSQSIENATRGDYYFSTNIIKGTNIDRDRQGIGYYLFCTYNNRTILIHEGHNDIRIDWETSMTNIKDDDQIGNYIIIIFIFILLICINLLLLKNRLRRKS